MNDGICFAMFYVSRLWRRNWVLMAARNFVFFSLENLLIAHTSLDECCVPFANADFGIRQCDFTDEGHTFLIDSLWKFSSNVIYWETSNHNADKNTGFPEFESSFICNFESVPNCQRTNSDILYIFEVLLAFPISNLVSAVTLEIRKNKKLERSACMQLDSACLHGLLLVCLFTFVVVWRGINSTKGDGNQMLSHIYEYKLFPFFYSVGFQMEFNLIVCNFIYILRINI